MRPPPSVLLGAFCLLLAFGTAAIAQTPIGSEPGFPWYPLAVTLVGAVISIGLAFFTAQRTARVETTKALVGAHQTMLVKLIEARLNTYPHMHTLLFNAYFSERTPDVTEAFDELKRLRDDVNAWFSCNGLLLGAETALACYELRRLLRHACVLYEDKSVDAEQRRQTQEALAHAGKHLLLGLRSDIGIYGINVAAGAGIATPIRSDWWSKSPEGPTP